MTTLDSDKLFSGSIPKLYETHLVPLIFEAYAADMLERLRPRALSSVLELAAGTGVVTRVLASGLPARVSIVATDLNQAMIDEAAAVGTERAVEWRQADALHLPFADSTFDAVVCQFGAMFFSDKTKAFSEVRRVLKPGGVFVFNVWDGLPDNDFANTVATAMESMFPDDPPRFLARTPYGYHDHRTIAQDLAAAGFVAPPVFNTVSARSRAASPTSVAVGYCQGTPLRGEIVARGATRLGEATDVASAAITKRFGAGAVEGKIQAQVVTIEIPAS